MATELAFAAYRPKFDTREELLEVLGEDVATLRRRGHVTERRAPVVRAANGDVLVVIEWSSDHAVDDAHADPEVIAVWERKGELADYIAPDALTGSEVPFARWTVIDDL